MYKGMKFYNDKKFWALAILITGIVLFVYWRWVEAGRPNFF